MTKRESGWYRCRPSHSEWFGLFMYDESFGKFEALDEYNNMSLVGDYYFDYIDPQMVMTTQGEIVYHNQHDQPYNTKQEG